VKNTKFRDAFRIASDMGNSRVQGVVMLCAIVKAIGAEEPGWRDILRKFVPSRRE